MTALEKYSFILCMIVYVVLAVFFTVLIVYLLRLTVRLIRHGAEDEKILAEYEKQRRGKAKKKNSVIEKFFTVIVYLAMFCMFAFAVYTQYTANNVTTSVPTCRVVLSGSMSNKYEKNEYLFKNNLNDQFNQFDLIITRQLPKEEDLKLYDIVVYEKDGVLLVHRIIGIEEPNEKHPNERYFRLQGDNVHVPDKYPVKYSQMKAIYRGERVPYVGSFIAFLQSPAGYMCFILVFLSVIFVPLLDKKVAKEKAKRLAILLAGAGTKKSNSDGQTVLPMGLDVSFLPTPCFNADGECPYREE